MWLLLELFMRKITDQKSNESRNKRPLEDELAASKKGSKGGEALVFADKVKDRRVQELALANKQLAFQIKEKEKRADELFIANKKLSLQNELTQFVDTANAPIFGIDAQGNVNEKRSLGLPSKRRWAKILWITLLPMIISCR
jgi:hypothetical protein